MRRPPLISFFAIILSIEAFYELLLFPLSSSQPELQQLFLDAGVNLSIMKPFGMVKGVYAAFCAWGLLKGYKPTLYVLWFLTPIFPVASLVLIGTIGLAPFSLLLTLLYVIYLRKPEYIAWFSQSDVTVKLEKQEHENQTNSSILGKIQTRFPILSTLALAIGGYFLINSILVFASFKWPINADLLLGFGIQFSLYSALTFIALRFKSFMIWKKRLGTQLIIASGVCIFYALMMFLSMNSPQFDQINSMLGGIINESYLIQILLYNIFLLSIGMPLRRSVSKS